jgi:hypothetical protein
MVPHGLNFGNRLDSSTAHASIPPDVSAMNVTGGVWLPLGGTAMAAQVFISHSSKDRKVARTICSALEGRGLSCWIASRDVGPGESFMDAIVRAIRAAKVMVLVFSENANNSDEIKREVVLAGNAKVTVIPVRVEDVMPADAFAYQFATRQWIDLFDDWENQIERLATWISGIVELGSAHSAAQPRIEPKEELQKPIPDTPAAEDERAPARSEAAETPGRSQPSGPPTVSKPGATLAPVADIAPPSPPPASIAKPLTAEPEMRSHLWALISSKAAVTATGVLLALQGIIQLVFWIQVIFELQNLSLAMVDEQAKPATIDLAVFFIVAGAGATVIGVMIAFRFRSARLAGLVACTANLISYFILLLAVEAFDAEGVVWIFDDDNMATLISVLAPVVFAVCLFVLWINRSSNAWRTRMGAGVRSAS